MLARSFHIDRRGGVLAGQAPTIQSPVIEETPQGLLIRYLRYWIEAGQQKAVGRSPRSKSRPWTRWTRCCACPSCASSSRCGPDRCCSSTTAGFCTTARPSRTTSPSTADGRQRRRPWSHAPLSTCPQAAVEGWGGAGWVAGWKRLADTLKCTGWMGWLNPQLRTAHAPTVLAVLLLACGLGFTAPVQARLKLIGLAHLDPPDENRSHITLPGDGLA